MKKITIYTVLFCLSCIPSLIHGADFYFTKAENTLSTGENQVVLKLKTGTDNLNAVSGKIEIPEGVDIVKINTGSSVVLMWIEQPKIGKTIVFSGITPGGFQGDVTLFSVGYRTKDSKPVMLKVVEGETVRNDGLGSSVAVKSIPFTLSPKQEGDKIRDEKDTYPPEPFAIFIGNDPLLFNGSRFISFAAQDKKSGVERYEWAHSFFFSPKEGGWQETTSPLVLTKGLYIQKVFIKAIDGEGNERISTINGPYRYAVLWIGIILILTVLCVLFFVRPSLYRFLQ